MRRWLSGLGDLVLTATSRKSRNYTFGLGLAAGHIAVETGKTVEGHATARAVEKLALARGSYNFV